MSDRDRRGDRPKRSWRDIDSGRDRARPPGGEGGERPRPAASGDQASKQHRAALEALFAQGGFGKIVEKMQPARPAAPTPPPAPVAAAAREGSPAADAEAAEKADKKVAAKAAEANPRVVQRKKILEAVGREQISRAVDKYVTDHGMPADFELLEQALDHQKEARVVEVLDALDRLLGREKPRRSRTLAGKLRFLEETSQDDDLRARAAQVRSKLG